MNLVLILLCLVLAFAQSSNISKPRLNHNIHNETAAAFSPIPKLPEERRQLPIYPRSTRKFIVTPLVYRRYVSQEPTTQTKKPLMKKLVLRDKRPNLIKVERITRRPVMNTKFLSQKPIHSLKETEKGVNVNKNLESIDEIAEVSYETRNKNFYDGDYSLHGDFSEDMTTVMYPNENNEKNTLTPAKWNGNSALTIEDFIFTPKVKLTEAINKESVDDIIFIRKLKPEQGSTKIARTNHRNVEDDNVSPEEIADWNEFIFLKENIIPSVLDKSIPPTETILPFKPKVKRCINVIEEENQGTTVSGFKLPFRDTNLENDLMFKNINS